jgi:hypothetical protein
MKFRPPKIRGKITKIESTSPEIIVVFDFEKPAIKEI